MKYCSICYEPIHILYYKSKCDCNLYYHLDCITNWYIHKNQCIQCRQQDNTSIQYILKKKNKIYEMIIIFISVILIIIYMIYASLKL